MNTINPNAQASDKQNSAQPDAGYEIGLDVGSTSTGWAAVIPGKSILGLGVRIYPLGVQLDKQGNKETSRNMARQTARSARRRAARYRQRREALLKLFKEVGIEPDTHPLSARELYLLRVKALDGPLTLGELGRLILWLNQRRGYKSNRKDGGKGEEEQKEAGVVKGAIAQLEAEMQASGARTLGEYFYRLFDQPNEHQNADAPALRIRKRWVSRQMYLHEYDAIIGVQRQHHAVLDRLVPRRKRPTPNDPRTHAPLHQSIRDEVVFYQRRLKPKGDLIGKCRFEPQHRCAPKASLIFQEFRVWEQISRLRVTEGDRVLQPLRKEEKEKIAEALKDKERLTLKTELPKLLFGKTRGVSFNDLDDLRGHSTLCRLREALGAHMPSEDEQIRQLVEWLMFYDDPEKLAARAERFGLPPEVARAYSEIALEEDFGSLSKRAMRRILPYLKGDAGDEDGVPQYLGYAEACAAAGYHHSHDAETQGKDRVLAEFVEALKPNELRSPLVQRAINETIKVVNALIKRYGKPSAIRIELARELTQPKEARERRRNEQRAIAERRDHFFAFLKSSAPRGVRVDKALVAKYELWLQLSAADAEGDDLKLFQDFSARLDLRSALKQQDKLNAWLQADRRCPYSGNTISLARLLRSDSDIDIDHILPFSRTADDSRLNKTVCTRKANEEKGNRTPHEWLSSNRDRWKTFKENIKAFPKRKQEKFLALNVPQEASADQLVQTARIARELSQRLKQAVRTVDTPNGQITAKLRETWGVANLHKVLSAELRERIQSAEAAKASGEKKQADSTEKKKDRRDHRHHALDALVVACANRSICQRWQREAKFDSYGTLHLNLPTPWHTFSEDAEAALRAVIVSYRPEGKLFTKRKNPYRWWGKDPETKEYLVSQPEGKRSAGVRGPLHEDTVYGLVQLPSEGKSKPSAGEAYVVRWPIDRFAQEKQLDDVVDPIVRGLMKARLKEAKGNFKEAFGTPDAPKLFMFSPRAKATIPIRSVRKVHVLKEDSASIRALRSRDGQPADYINPGSNPVVAIYGELIPAPGQKKARRDFEMPSLLECAKRKQRGEPLYPKQKNGLPLLMVLRPDDPVVIFDKHPDEIDWNDPLDLANRRLYRVGKFTGGSIYLAHQHLAKVDLDRDPSPLKYTKAILSTFMAVPVRIDSLGRIQRL